MRKKAKKTCRILSQTCQLHESINQLVTSKVVIWSHRIKLSTTKSGKLHFKNSWLTRKQTLSRLLGVYRSSSTRFLTLNQTKGRACKIWGIWRLRTMRKMISWLAKTLRMIKIRIKASSVVSLVEVRLQGTLQLIYLQMSRLLCMRSCQM